MVSRDKLSVQYSIPLNYTPVERVNIKLLCPLFRTAWFLLLINLMCCPLQADDAVLSGEFKTWHCFTLTFEGPDSSETATPNPFTDYRLDVTFRNQNHIFKVPGYYAADGQAAHSGAEQGNQWRVHFTPPQTGNWTYSVCFRTGSNIAMNTDANAGRSAGFFDGSTGSFSIAPTDKKGKDFRRQGRLQYVGEHYMRFAESGTYFLKVGPDSPEGFLANPDIDCEAPAGTRSNFAAHGKHWNPGDPTWKDGQGKNLIGAINYISEKGMNCFYLLTYSAHGDTRSVWPYRGKDDRFRFDCSKLDQWGILFEHMDHKGILKHIVLSETENEAYWEVKDGVSTSDSMSPSRKLFYREHVARYGHNLALVWNLGEENGFSDSKGGALGVGNSDAQRKLFCDFLRELDPYDSPIVVHHFPGKEDELFTPLLGYPHFEGMSYQLGYNKFSMRRTNETVRKWVGLSAKAGRKWLVSMDEPGHEGFPRGGLGLGDDTAGIRPDKLDPTHDDPRTLSLWGTFMGGGSGHESYFGWAYTPHGGGDGSVDNYAAWDQWWDQCRYAQTFFTRYLPFHEMAPENALTKNEEDFVFAKRGDIYAIYLRKGGSTEIDLRHASGTFEVLWYNPRMGGALATGSLTTVSGGDWRAIGNAPSNPEKDWTVLIRKSNDDDQSPPP